MTNRKYVSRRLPPSAWKLKSNERDIIVFATEMESGWAGGAATGGHDKQNRPSSYRKIPSLRENKLPKYTSRGGQRKQLDDYLRVLWGIPFGQ